MREVISHHYFDDIDAEIVFNACDRHIKPLADAVEMMLADLPSTDETLPNP